MKVRSRLPRRKSTRHGTGDLVRVAQLVERHLDTVEVAGSSPALHTFTGQRGVCAPDPRLQGAELVPALRPEAISGKSSHRTERQVEHSPAGPSRHRDRGPNGRGTRSVRREIAGSSPVVPQGAWCADVGYFLYSRGGPGSIPGRSTHGPVVWN